MKIMVMMKMMITVGSVLYYIIWFIPVLIIHEFGHYVGYRIFGIRPKITFKWWGISIGESKDFFKLNPPQFFIIVWMGVMAGFIYTIPFQNYLVLVYGMMSFIDIMHMINVLKGWKWKSSYGDFVIYDLKKTISEWEKARWER